MKRLLYGIVSILFFVIIVFPALNIQLVKASTIVDQIVYINADGTVDPSTAPIQRNGDVYTLIDNLTINASPGIVILKDNVTLDGAGHTVVGGIYLSDVKNVTIENLRIIHNLSNPIRLRGNSMNNTIIRNYIDSLGFVGIIIEANASSNRIIENTIQAVGGYRSFVYDGISCASSSNYIYGNRITFPWWGVPPNENSGISLLETARFNFLARNEIHISYSSWDISCYGANNTISEHTFEESLRILGTNNKFYRNNVVPRDYTFGMDGSRNNTYDDGYPVGGNYWYLWYVTGTEGPAHNLVYQKFHFGFDLFSGPYQNQSRSDGIVDEPFTHYRGFTDHYPLMMPWTATPTPPIAKISPTDPIVTKRAGEPVMFNASLSNVGWNGTQYMPIIEYQWDFGDGSSISTEINETAHIYKFAGTYNVTLTVFDSEGSKSLSSQKLIVNMPTSLSISTSPSSTIAGFAVGINGTLYDIYGKGLENKQVLFYYIFTGANSWSQITSALTDSQGHYNIQWVPTATGYFTLKAEWAGNATHLQTSKNITLSVIPYQNQYAFSVESNSTISALVFNSTSQTLSFTASGPNGTHGYARVVIAKNLVPDIANTKVFLNGTEWQYSNASSDNSWILTFTYDHSIRQIEMQFSPSNKFFGLDWWVWIIMIIGGTTAIIGTAITLRRRNRLHAS